LAKAAVINLNKKTGSKGAFSDCDHFPLCDPWLDPAYRGLEPLFQKVTKQDRKNLYWVATTVHVYMKNPEFLHEALQPIILNFLIEHATTGLMQLEKHPNYQKIEPISRGVRRR